jgi:hypothetical protein
VSVRIYVEGGFEGSTKTNCRKAFRIFFEKVLPRGSFQVIASGDRAAAFKDFSSALRKHRGDYIVLLVDSEEAVAALGHPWQHLNTRVGDNLHRPNGAQSDQAHLMVQAMESWFLADQQALADYYGPGFLRNSLPGQPDIEQIAKEEVFRVLRHASRHTQKGEYHKTRHGFELLEEIDPHRVRRASGHADRLFVVLERETSP